MYKENKKAALEIQFNWIFVLIVGGVIFMFFFSVIKSQQETSEKEIAATLVRNIDTITTGAKESRFTAQKIPLPDTEINFECGGCDCLFSIKGIPQRYGEKVLFSPNKVTGKSLLAWSLEWNVPYRATNFLYLTSPRVKYFLVYDASRNPQSEALLDEINASLTSEIDREKVEIGALGGIINENYEKTRFIFVDVSAVTMMLDSSFADEDVSAVHITEYNGGTRPSMEIGKVMFYNKPYTTATTFTTETSYYIGTASLYAAIISEEPEGFNCNMESAFKRMRAVTRIYQNRTLIYDEIYQSDEDCFNNYDYVETELRDILIRSSTLSKDYPPGTVVPVLNLMTSIESLRTKQESLHYSSCPQIY